MIQTKLSRRGGLHLAGLLIVTLLVSIFVSAPPTYAAAPKCYTPDGALNTDSDGIYTIDCSVGLYFMGLNRQQVPTLANDKCYYFQATGAAEVSCSQYSKYTVSHEQAFRNEFSNLKIPGGCLFDTGGGIGVYDGVTCQTSSGLDPNKKQGAFYVFTTDSWREISQTEFFNLIAANNPESVADTSGDPPEAGLCTGEDVSPDCSFDQAAIEQRLGATGNGGECGGVELAFNVGCDNRYGNPIIAYLMAIIRFLTFGVGVTIIAVIIVGGIQYASAGGNAQTVQAAKNRILNAVIALLLYIFAFAILNYVTPGGLIGG